MNAGAQAHATGEMPVQRGRCGAELSRDELCGVELRLLDAFCRACDDNGLRYFLYYGTLIGAVRHNGFIPWDDDVDLAMPRQDYERLTTIDWRRYGVSFLSHAGRRDYPHLAGKVVDHGTVLHQSMDHALEGMGVWIDIFPVDEVPDSAWTERLEQNCLRAIEWIRRVKVRRPSAKRAGWKNLALSVAKLLLVPISPGFLVRWAHAIASRHRTAGHRVGSRVGPYGDREIVPRRLFDRMIEVEFEGRRLPAPSGYHEILTQIYGDYMVPPPPEKRIAHHPFRAYWGEDTSDCPAGTEVSTMRASDGPIASRLHDA